MNECWGNSVVPLIIVVSDEGAVEPFVCISTSKTTPPPSGFSLPISLPIMYYCCKGSQFVHSSLYPHFEWSPTMCLDLVTKALLWFSNVIIANVTGADTWKKVLVYWLVLALTCFSLLRLWDYYTNKSRLAT